MEAVSPPLVQRLIQAHQAHKADGVVGAQHGVGGGPDVNVEPEAGPEGAGRQGGGGGQGQGHPAVAFTHTHNIYIYMIV